MKIKIEIECTSEEALKFINNRPIVDFDFPNYPVAKDFKGNQIIENLGRYKFSTAETSRRPSTDTLIFDESLVGMICYVKKIISEDIIEVSVPGQRGWETPILKLKIHPHWIEYSLTEGCKKT